MTQVAGVAPRIQGVQVKQLRVVPDERGWLMEILRRDETELLPRFGQVYVSATYPGVVKAWHFHKLQVDNFACVAGMVKLVLVDTREGSPTKGAVNEFFVGDWNQMIVRIPPGVYHGFKCISDHEAIVVNMATEVYNYDKPDEFRIEPHTAKIPYDWARKDG